MTNKKIMRSFRFSASDVAQLKQLAEQLHCSQTTVIEKALQLLTDRTNN